MRRRNILLFPLTGLLSLMSLLSCGVDRWAEYYPRTERDLWIDEVMRQEYLWYQDIPTFEELNYFLSPQAFLEKVKSPRDKGFSTIDTVYATPPPTHGFNYTLYKVAGNDTAYNALITHVIPRSPASEAGLKRGDWIMKIDTALITKKNEKLLTDLDTCNYLIGKFERIAQEAGTLKDTVIANRTTTILGKKEVGAPIVPTAITFTLGTTQVGYLVYNSFSPEANEALIQLSHTFNEQKITQCIVDLRYNAGGEMECVQLLANLLAPANKSGSLFATLKYSDQKSTKNRDLHIDTQLTEGGTNLNLNKVYLLTSNKTAAASEMLINCLHPHAEVILIGGTTKGVYVATESFVNEKYHWVLRPAVCEVFNAEGKAEYTQGFVPQKAVNEMADLSRVLPLGNPDEALLNTALALIVNEVTPPQPTNIVQLMIPETACKTPRHSSGLSIH